MRYGLFKHVTSDLEERADPSAPSLSFMNKKLQADMERSRLHASKFGASGGSPEDADLPRPLLKTSGLIQPEDGTITRMMSSNFGGL